MNKQLKEKLEVLRADCKYHGFDFNRESEKMLIDFLNKYESKLQPERIEFTSDNNGVIGMDIRYGEVRIYYDFDQSNEPVRHSCAFSVNDYFVVFDGNVEFTREKLRKGIEDEQ